MRSVKPLTILLILSLLVTLFAGCGSTKPEVNNPEKSDNPTTKPVEKSKLKVWTMGRPDKEYYLSKINPFNETNPDGIEIVYEVFTDNYPQTIELAYATGEGPDVYLDANGVYEKMLPMGNLMPLDQFLTEDYKKRFGEGAFLEGINMYEGKIYSMPGIGSSARLIYNKGIFAKAGISAPPKSLDELVETARTITNKLKGEGIYGFAANLKTPLSAFNRSIDYIVMRSGGVRSGYDFKNGKYNFDDYRPVLEAYREIFAKDIAFPGCESLEIDPLRTQFAAGKIGMYISWSHAEPNVYAHQFTTTEEWDVAQIPTIDGTVKGSTNIFFAGRWYVMNSKTKDPQKAWKVMELLYSDEVAKGYYENGFGLLMIPSIVEKAKKPASIEERPELAFTQYDKMWPGLPINVSPEGKDMYSVYAAVVLGVTDLDAAIQDLNTRYNAAFEKAISEGKTKRILNPDFDPFNPGKGF